MAGGVLGGDRLAEDHRTGLTEPRDDGGVVPRRPPLPQWGSHFGRHVGRVEDVLDADRHAVQRPGRLPLLAPEIGVLRLPPRDLRQHCLADQTNEP